MINSEQFLSELQKNGVGFYTGVLDSLLKNLCACITDKIPESGHIITANEGAAVALATGYYLATGKVPLVYMQNSGLGNAINPLLSLADPEVYSIPILLVIGWRGEPGVKDEPQHVKQGRVQNELLDKMEVPFEIIDAETTAYTETLKALLDIAISESRPVALVVRKGTFSNYTLPQKEAKANDLISREDAITELAEQLGNDDIIISTTGKTSRELFEVRAGKSAGHQKDFLTVGSMGHSSQIVLGIALQKPDRQVFCFDGDGAIIMHMGSLAITGNNAGTNFKHIVFNNGAYDSVGGQPTVGFSINMPEIAKHSGYKQTKRVVSLEALAGAIQWIKSAPDPALLEVWVAKGARKDLGRPNKKPIENKSDFMKYVQD